MTNIFEHYASGENLYNQLIASVYEGYGLTFMEFTILMFLANNNQYDTAAEIVRYHHLAKSHVSVSVNSLSEKKLINEEYMNNNKKSIHLSVTELAKPIVEDGRAVQKKFRDLLLSGFTEDEKTMFLHFIARIDKNISANLIKECMKKQSGGKNHGQ